MLDQYQVIAILLAFISVLIGLILYQLSKIFNLVGLKRYSELLIWEAFVTILLAMFLFIIIDKLNNFLYDISIALYKTIGKDVSGVDPKTPMAIAKQTLSTLISDCYFNYYGSLLMLKAVLESMGTALSEIKAENTQLPTSQAIYSIIWIRDLLKFTYFLIWTGMVMFKILVFFSAYYPFLIMLGIILRAFEPTKSLGAYLISLGIGLYIVLPMGYNIGLVMNYNEIVCKISNNMKSNEELANSYYNIFDIGENARSMVGLTTFLAVHLNLISILLLSPNDLIRIIYSILAISLIAPLIAFIIALSFVNISTTALGGRISEVGRGLFKLV